MKKIGIFVFLILMTGGLFAQMDEGMKMLNYERFQSAANIFKSVLDKDAKNTEAAYWLGQTFIQNTENVDTAAVKSLYQKTLQENPNDPLLMVGVGEVELLEGKTTDAKNHFDAALALVKKKGTVPVLLAIGRANIDTKDGDLKYAVDVLNQAAAAKKLSKEEQLDIQMRLGDAYRKLIEGGNAVTHYQQALMLDPNAARASFMMGRIYETQGITQENIYMNYYYDAIREDPHFAPVYYWLYQYYYNRDVNKARQYLNDYVENTDQDSKLCYAQASLFYVSKLYEQTIAKADSCIGGSGTEKPFPNLFGLKAYAYDKLNDKDNARKFFEEFFQRVNPDNIGPNDYLTYGKVLFKFPGEENLAAQYIEKAVNLDTLKANKVNYITDVAKTMFNNKDYAQAAVWYTKLLAMDTAQSIVDLYYSGYSNYLASNYTTADSIFNIYNTKYPTDLTGLLLGARTKEAMDTSGKEGLAKPLWDRIIAIGDTSTNKDAMKAYLLPAYKYMVAYFYNVKEDIESAAGFNTKILELDPTDANATANGKVFEAMLKNRANNSAKKDNK